MQVVCTSPHIVAKCASNSGSDTATVPTLGLVLSPRPRACVSKDIHNLQHEQADRQTVRPDRRTDGETNRRADRQLNFDRSTHKLLLRKIYIRVRGESSKVLHELGCCTHLARTLSRSTISLSLSTDKGLNWQLAISGYYSVLGA